MNSTPEEVIQGCEPTAEERELFNWSEEIASKEIGLVHDSLRHLVTLTAALLAGSAAVLNQVVLAPWCKVAGLSLLLVSLIAALWGSLPITASFEPGHLDGIRKARAGGLRFRTRCLKVTAWCLVLALTVLLAGLLMG